MDAPKKLSKLAKKSPWALQLEETIKTGTDSYRAGAEASNNPYPATDLRHTAWLTGWHAERIHQEGALARELDLECEKNPYVSGTTFPGLEETSFDASVEWEFGWVNYSKIRPRRTKTSAWPPPNIVLSFST